VRHNANHSFRRLSAALAAGAVVAMAVALWAVSEHQRSVIDHANGQSRAGQAMLTSVLDMEGGVRGYTLTGRQEFLDTQQRAFSRFVAAVAAARPSTTDDAPVKASLDRQLTIAQGWKDLAVADITAATTGASVSKLADGAVARNGAVEQFRAENAVFLHLLDARQSRSVTEARSQAIVILVVLALTFGGLGYVLVTRRALREERYRARLAELGEALQSSMSEGDADLVLSRHLAEEIPGATAVVATRNTSNNRLEPRMTVADDSPLAARLAGATPNACLAVRRGRRHESLGDDAELSSCELCAGPGSTTCSPLLVTGELLGCVLVNHDRRLTPPQRRILDDGLALAAPTLANLRNLASAEARAATDALTGLPNRRTIDLTLRRLLTQAGRSDQHLAAVMLDLDHFKEINDTFGHDVGDDVLAGVAIAISAGLRPSDFAGRNGGEEFLVLLPDTAAAEAAERTERLRKTIHNLEIPGLEAGVTASFGVALFPEDAVTGHGLLRAADMALYRAKGGGRDRVEFAPSARAGIARLEPVASTAPVVPANRV
jgi:diguanylate cyclase (GGDEF)-like protein